MSATQISKWNFKIKSYTYTYFGPDWEIGDDGMVAQSSEELELGTLPIFTELAAEINNAIRAKQSEQGLPVTPKWIPTTEARK